MKFGLMTQIQMPRPWGENAEAIAGAEQSVDPRLRAFYL